MPGVDRVCYWDVSIYQKFVDNPMYLVSMLTKYMGNIRLEIGINQIIKGGVDMSETEIYDRFVEWLQTSWFGVPESEHMMPTVQAQYTLEEAEFLTGMPFRPTTLSELAELKQMEESELAGVMDGMAVKGLVWRVENEKGLRYLLNDLFFVIMRSTFWRDRKNKESVEVAKEANKYYYNGLFKDLVQMHYGGLRTIPIEKTVASDKEIRPYEDVVGLLDKFEYYTVSDCPCCQRKKLDPEYETSSKPLEVCLHFDALGKYIVESGMGREITREETEAILAKSAKAGLVHGVSNWEHKPDTI
jgi:hypothetical protein